MDPRINLRTPWLAALLAYLIPGAGHLYQRRYFKAGVYSVCILGMFCWGMVLGDWKVVYAQWRSAPGRPRKVLSYCAQAGVGLPALPAIVQSYRYESARGTEPFAEDPERNLRRLEESLTARFRGEIRSLDDEPGGGQAVEGTVSLQPADGEFGWGVAGTFRGVDADGNAIELSLGEPFEIGPRLSGARRRFLSGGILEDGHQVGTLEGTIPRPLWNWFQIPLGPKVLADWHRHCGKLAEYAQVFTWIAGLLNILAVWDAAQGPAYGYGEEDWVQRHPEPEPDAPTPSPDPVPAEGSSENSPAN